MSAMSEIAIRDAREAVALACRLHGRQRGWYLAARLLGIAERTARAIQDGTTSGATIHPETAFAARMAFRHARADQIRAELRDLECEHAEILDAPRAGLGMGR